MISNKNIKKVLVFIDFYLPGINSGGSPRSIYNQVKHLNSKLKYKIITRDHDLGDSNKYSNIPSNKWINKLQVARQSVVAQPGSRFVSFVRACAR